MIDNPGPLSTRFQRSFQQTPCSARQRTQKTSPIGISLFQFPEIKALGEEGFSYVFEGSEVLAKATEGLDPKTCKYTTTILFDYNYLL